MKKVSFSSLALCLIVSACTNNDLFNSQMSNEDTPAVQVESTTPTMCKAKAAALVRQNPNLFGNNVMIFESYEELDTTLSQIQEMDYKALRVWATESNVQNDILESNIIYSEEWEKAWELWNEKINRLDTTKFGTIGDLNHTFATPHIRIPDTGIPAIGLEERAIDSFLDEMRKNYPQYLQEYDSLGEHYIEPLGALGEEALVNEKNLFLVGDEVHRFYKDGEIQCALEDYNQIAHYETKAEVMDYVKELQRNQQKAPQVTMVDLDNDKDFTETSGKYRMNVSFTVGQIHTIFGTDMRHLDVRIHNYHKNSRGSWVGIACKTKLNLTAETSSTFNKQYTFNVNRNGYILGSHRRYTKTLNNPGKYVMLTSYNLNATNQHGLQIKRINQ